MNREIKFRGKKTSNGKWIYGDLVQYETGGMSIFKEKMKAYGYEATEIYKRSEITPKTIGQYTGLKDKNGKEIYEGDIVKVYDDYIGKVFWDDFYGGWFITADEPQPLYDATVEVIGNAYENSELLGQEEK